MTVTVLGESDLPHHPVPNFYKLTVITVIKYLCDRHNSHLLIVCVIGDIDCHGGLEEQSVTTSTVVKVHMKAHPRSYSRSTREALTMMGGLIRLARKQRRMSEAELADRIGIARSTLQLIERGHPKVEVGLVFEAATLVGVPLFVEEPSRLAGEISRINDKLALLPQSVRRPRTEVKDDF